MCGRFPLKKAAAEIIDELGIDSWPDQDRWLPGYNFAPTRETPVMARAGHLRLMRWGLIPAWAQDKAIGNRLINARSETLMQKPSFRDLVPKRRCAVITQGYYEWKREGKAKRPYYIHRRDDKLMTMAGLWDAWRDPDGATIHSYTIITTTPADSIAFLHDRMPVILAPDQLRQWLEGSTDDAVDLLRPYAGELDHYEVSSVVNNVRHDVPACIKPKAEDQGLLF